MYTLGINGNWWQEVGSWVMIGSWVSNCKKIGNNWRI